jgi:hypothetical protein
MNPELGVDSHQEVDVVGHGTQLDDFSPSFLAYVFDDLLQPGVDISGDHRAAVLRAPDNVIGAPVDNVVVGFDRYHGHSIQVGAIYCAYDAMSHLVGKLGTWPR